jgi:hypothetical protein
MATNDCTNLLNSAVTAIHELACDQQTINNNIQVIQNEINDLTDEINNIKMGNDIFVGSVQNDATEIDDLNNVSILTENNYTLTDTNIRDGFMKVLVNGNENAFDNIALGLFDGNNSLYSKCATYDPINDTLYLGLFTNTILQLNFTKLNFNYICSYKISSGQFNYLGTSASNGVNGVQSVNFVKYIPSPINKIVVAGSFTTVSDNSGTKTANRIALWNPISNLWEVLGLGVNNGVNGNVNSCDYDPVNNTLYVGGTFTQATDSLGTYTMSRIARWNFNPPPLAPNWEYVGVVGSNGVNNTVNSVVYVDTSTIKQVFVGGLFTTASYAGPTSISANFIVCWNIASNAWLPLGTGATNGVNAQVTSIVQSINDVYIAGSFTTATTASGTISANYVVFWDTLTNSWNPLGLGSSNGIISSTSVNIALLNYKNNIYVFITNVASNCVGVSDRFSTKQCIYDTALYGDGVYFGWNIISQTWNILLNSNINIPNFGVCNIDNNRYFVFNNIVTHDNQVSINNNNILFSGVIYKNMKMALKGANISIIWSESLNTWIVYGEPSHYLFIKET